MPNHRDKPSEENGECPFTLMKKPLGHFEVVLIQKQVFSNFQNQRLASIKTHPVREKGAKKGASAGRENRQPEIPSAISNLEADERHYRLARDRRNHALQRHEA